MAAKSRFILKRKDSDVSVDDVVLETEGLVIGRLISNELVLNHRAVSRTHAGINQIGSDFWLFNLSKSNGTSLNGELVDRTALADGDVIQIGPYLLRVSYQAQALAITVERQLQVQTAEGSIVLPAAPPGVGEGDASATIVIKAPVIPGPRRTPDGSGLVQGTGLLTGVLRAVDEQALEIFWKKPTPTWGGMLADGRVYLSTAWWLATFPGLAILMTVLGINLLGDGLRDTFDPRLKV